MKDADYEKLNNIFDIDSVRPKTTEVKVVQEPLPQIEEKDSDFDLARKTLRGLINKNEEVLDNIISLAKSSETPRTFEVAGQLLKTQSEMAKDLMELHKQKKDIEKEEPKKIGTQNNVVFAGSTADIMKLINGEQPKIIDAN